MLWALGSVSMVRKPNTESTHSNTPAQPDNDTGGSVHARNTVPEAHYVCVAERQVLVPGASGSKQAMQSTM